MCGIEGSMFSGEEFDTYLKMLRKEFQNICLERWVVFHGIFVLHRGSTVLAACEIQRQVVNHSAKDRSVSLRQAVNHSAKDRSVSLRQAVNHSLPKIGQCP